MQTANEIKIKYGDIACNGNINLCQKQANCLLFQVFDSVKNEPVTGLGVIVISIALCPTTATTFYLQFGWTHVLRVKLGIMAVLVT